MDTAKGNKGPLGLGAPLHWWLEFGQAIHDYARLESTVLDRWMKPLGITRAQGFILVFLSWHPGAKQTELAALLEVSRAAAGGLVHRLIERQLVESLEDPKDRRAARIFLTVQGRQVVKDFSIAGLAINKVVMADFDEKEGRRLIAIFAKMKERLAAVGEPSFLASLGVNSSTQVATAFLPKPRSKAVSKNSSSRSRVRQKPTPAKRKYVAVGD